MLLSPDEIKLFYSNFLGLLSFVNDKYNLIQDFGHPKDPAELLPKNVVTLKDKLWDDIEIIDEYINSRKKMTKEQLQILEGWHNRISGNFVLMKYLKKYAVFLDQRNNLLYGVIGITNPINLTLPHRLPILIKAVLLPFNDMIIYDSILQPFDIQFGKNVRSDLNEKYTEIKKEKGIITTIYCSYLKFSDLKASKPAVRKLGRRR
ncbi:MAG: hypothetical protein LBP59_15025 [Planctomycetaceae bacterium]|jgi:hypothetical protein|nr:hypothetical protein [Planctomycetaceae bacterium]